MKVVVYFLEFLIDILNRESNPFDEISFNVSNFILKVSLSVILRRYLSA